MIEHNEHNEIVGKLRLLDSQSLAEIRSSLSESGIALSIVSRKRKTPLHIIANSQHYRNPDLVKALVEAGTQIRALDSTYSSALDIALTRAKQPIVAAILEAGEPYSAEEIENLKLKPRNPDIEEYVQERLKSYALTSFIRRGGTEVDLDRIVSSDSPYSFEALEKFLQANSNIELNFTDKSDTTPLMKVAKWTNANCYQGIELLLNLGAKADACDGTYHNALHYVVTQSKRRDIVRIMELLISKGSSIEGALIPAAKIQNEQVRNDGIDLLLKHGADPNQISTQGMTSLKLLLITLTSGAYSTYKKLVEAGASIDFTDPKGSLLVSKVLIIHILISLYEL